MLFRSFFSTGKLLWKFNHEDTSLLPAMPTPSGELLWIGNHFILKISSCSGNGNSINNTICECEVNYYTSNCSVYCHPSNCTNGYCNNNTGLCECNEGYSNAPDCQLIPTCNDEDTCSSNGKCNKQGKCDCDKSTLEIFYGDHCENHKLTWTSIVIIVLSCVLVSASAISVILIKRKRSGYQPIR